MKEQIGHSLLDLMVPVGSLLVELDEAVPDAGGDLPVEELEAVGGLEVSCWDV